MAAKATVIIILEGIFLIGFFISPVLIKAVSHEVNANNEINNADEIDVKSGTLVSILKLFISRKKSPMTINSNSGIILVTPKILERVALLLTLIKLTINKKIDIRIMVSILIEGSKKYGLI